MCSCPPRLVIVECGFATCQGCGVTQMKQLEPMIPFMGGYTKLQRAPYCRRKRFARILSNSYGHRVPRVCPGLIDLITEKRCKTSAEILRIMKASTVRSFKRYDALALLARQLTDDVPRPLSVHEHEWCLVLVERRRNYEGRFRPMLSSLSCV